MPFEILFAVQLLLREAARLLAGYRQRARAWHDLQALDPHALRDLGLSHRAVAERWNDGFHDVGQEEPGRGSATAALHAGFTQGEHHSRARVQQTPAQAV
jgi:uncharacterized protein YjiS (DUF1127 family)